MTARALLPTLAALAVLAAPPAARALEPQAGGLVDFTGARALGLSAATGVASGNDGLFVNPGAVAARKRYSIEAIYAADRRGPVDAGRWAGASVVDGLSSAVTTSLAWVRPLEGFQQGNLLVGGLAGPVMDRLWVGAQLRWYDLREEVAPGTTQRFSAFTGDAGLYWELGDLVSVGAAGFNLVPTGHERSTPRSVGAGLAVGSDTSVKLTADWRADLERASDAGGRARTTNRYGAGVEVLLAQMVPVRGGFLKDETLATTWWSAGVGLVAASGVALDLGYRQSVTRPDARILAVSLKLQFLEL